MSGPNDWRRIVASGALWTLAYNFVWGVAWFAFMRKEWEQAVAAIRHPMPWTAEAWFLWVALTVPMGIAIMAYSAGRVRPSRAAISAAAAIWLLLTVGVSAYSLSESLSIRVIALDASVNLVAMIAASVIGAWSQGEA
jgi:hypothetical protein